MAVLVEAISIIIRGDSILDKFPGSWEAFQAFVPNESWCADGELVSIPMMMPSDALSFAVVRN